MIVCLAKISESLLFFNHFAPTLAKLINICHEFILKVICIALSVHNLIHIQAHASLFARHAYLLYGLVLLLLDDLVFQVFILRRFKHFRLV